MSPDDPLVQKQILHALDEPQWTYRTIPGIAWETGLSPGVVAQVLEHSPCVRVVRATDRNGNLLYARKDQPVTAKERLAVFREALALR